MYWIQNNVQKYSLETNTEHLKLNKKRGMISAYSIMLLAQHITLQILYIGKIMLEK